MYQELKPDEYKKLSLEQRVGELKKWLEDQILNMKAIIRSVAGTIPEANTEIEEVILSDFRYLPKMINDYDDDSAAYALLKYRLENNIVNCGDTVLDTDMFGAISVKECGYCDSEENIQTLDAQRNLADELITLCRMFQFKDLETTLHAWRP